MVLFMALGILTANAALERGVPDATLWGIEAEAVCWGALLLLSVIFMSISTLCFKDREWIFILAGNLFFFSTGGYLLTDYDMPTGINDDEAYVRCVELVSAPIEKNGYFRADAVVVEGRGEGEKVLLHLQADTAVAPPRLCDRYLIHSKMFVPKADGTPVAFDYGKYLRRHGYSGVSYVYAPYYKLVSHGKPTTWDTKAEALRISLTERYKAVGIDGAELSILTAITLGEKGLLTAEQKADFTAAGVQHILVVSGLHVGFIFMIVVFVLSRVRGVRRRRLLTCVGIAVLWAYAMLTGMAPAVVRASIMFTIMLAFYVSGEYYRTYHALLIAALTTLAVNPYLLFDVGFLLSYTAVWSISAFYPKIYGAYMRLGVKSTVADRLMQAVCVTISAQILTFPIVLYSFYQFPTYFVITNIIASFVTPLLFCGGMILLAVSGVPYIGVWTGAVMEGLVRMFEAAVSTIAGLPQAVVHTYVSGVEVAGLYAVIAAVCNVAMMWKYSDKRYGAWLIAGCVVLGFAGISTAQYYADTEGEKMYVLEQKRLCVNVVSKERNVVFAAERDTAFLRQRLLPLHLKHHAPRVEFVTDTSVMSNCFKYRGETYMILRDNIFRYKYNTGNPLKVDCLIVDRGVYPTEKLFDRFVSPRRLLLTEGVWRGYVPMFVKIAGEKGIIVNSE